MTQGSMGYQPGVLVVNKPPGMTSHDVVDEVRKITGFKKVGHAGTLDPTATGVLVILVGRSATKQSDKLRGEDKEYVFEIEFGKATDTGDTEGRVVSELEPSDDRLLRLSEDNLQKTLGQFKGEYQQQVPIYSAVKVQGTKLYEIARGQKQSPPNLEIPTRLVTIREIDLLDFKVGDGEKYPVAKIDTVVSSGTYTRSLVRDVGQALGVPVTQTSLVRTRSGKFRIEQAVLLEELTPRDVLAIRSCK